MDTLSPEAYTLDGKPKEPVDMAYKIAATKAGISGGAVRGHVVLKVEEI